MSAQFKLAKKKYTQNDLRRLMQEQKSKSKPGAPVEQKIESPLAKYNDLGQLTCILCKSVVRSESVWKVHINSKAHKENVAAAKQLKEKLANSVHNTNGGHKRLPEPTSAVESVPEKKHKPSIKEEVGLPSDFFDSGTDSKIGIKKEPSSIKKDDATQMEVDESKTELPEGFFDDPIKDAKIRNIEYKDPQDEEWEKFQREIKEEATVSNAIIAGEQDNATAERQIEEIDEQIHNWSRVLEMEKKKEVIVQKAKHRPTPMERDSDESDGEESDEKFDEFLDWRAKKLQKL